MAINREELVAALAAKADTSKSEAEALLTAFKEVLEGSGETVQNPEILLIELKSWAARNPAVRRSGKLTDFAIGTGGLVRTTAINPLSDVVGVKDSTTARTILLTEAVGGSASLARLLRVSKSQTTRWKSGQSTPNPETARVLIDLDHVVARAHMLWPPAVALEWLDSPNAFLGGSTPLNVIEVRGAAEVIEALDATLAGSFA